MAAMRFAVYGRRDELLGYVAGDSSKCGDSLLPLARELSAKKYHVAQSEIVLEFFQLSSGPVPLGTASNMSMSMLFNEEAKLYVQGPESEPAYVRDLKDTISELKQDAANMHKRISVLEKSHALQQRLALRSLLDKSRNTLAGRELKPDERSTWNSKVNSGAFVVPPGVSLKAVSLTTFGPDSEQEAGNAAAHDFDVSAIADAVVSQPPKKGALYRMLFQMCFHKSADDVILDQPESDDDTN